MRKTNKLSFLLILIILFTINITPTDKIEQFAKTYNLKKDKLLKAKKFIRNNKDKFLWKLVNKDNELNNNYIPKKLKKIPLKYTKNRNEIYVKELIYKNLVKMIKNAKKKGIKLRVLSGYRSYEYQKKLYNNMLNKYGEKFVKKFIAKAGHSEHQLGTVLDFNSLNINKKSKIAFKWLSDNAWEYGFSLSYSKNNILTDFEYEPWHYRYVGPEAAKIIKDYFKGDQKLFLKFANNYITYDN